MILQRSEEALLPPTLSPNDTRLASKNTRRFPLFLVIDMWGYHDARQDPQHNPIGQDLGDDQQPLASSVIGAFMRWFRGSSPIIVSLE